MLTITDEQRAAIAEKLTDENSEVIGNWMLNIQDRMSDAMRNGADWRYLLPLAAGTGRDHEQQRIDIILDWMWDALALVQPTADEEGFGNEWRTMCTERTPDAVANAAIAANAEEAAAAAANVAAYAANRAANRAAWAAEAAADVAAYAAEAADDTFWQQVNPPALLLKLINVTHEVKLKAD